MHFVYFLWSEKLQKVYIGETADVQHRLEYHNKGLQRYTKKGTPWKLIAFVSFDSKEEARREERRLKKCKNRNYLRRYIQEHGRTLRG